MGNLMPSFFLSHSMLNLIDTAFSSAVTLLFLCSDPAFSLQCIDMFGTSYSFLTARVVKFHQPNLHSMCHFDTGLLPRIEV